MSSEGFDGGPTEGAQPRPRRAYQDPDEHEAFDASETGQEPGGTRRAEEETHHPGFEPASDDDTDPLPIMSPTEVDPEPSIDADPTEPPEIDEDQGPTEDEAHPLPVMSPAESEDVDDPVDTPLIPGDSAGQAHTTEVPGAPADDPSADSRNPLLYVLGALLLLGVIVAVVWFLLRGDEPSAVPAPPPTTATTAAAVDATAAETPAETPDPAPTTVEPTSETTPATSPSADPVTSEPVAPAAEPTTEPTEIETIEPEAEPTTAEPVSNPQPAPAGAEPQPLTADHLPASLLGYTLTTTDGTLAYQQGDTNILLLDLGITTVDPGWQEMLFPDPTELNGNVLCSTDANGAENCLIKDTPHGVITVGDGVSGGVAELAVAIADHLT